MIIAYESSMRKKSLTPPLSIMTNMQNDCSKNPEVVFLHVPFGSAFY